MTLERKLPTILSVVGVDFNDPPKLNADGTLVYTAYIDSYSFEDQEFTTGTLVIAATEVPGEGFMARVSGNKREIESTRVLRSDFGDQEVTTSHYYVDIVPVDD